MHFDIWDSFSVSIKLNLFVSASYNNTISVMEWMVFLENQISVQYRYILGMRGFDVYTVVVVFCLCFC